MIEGIPSNNTGNESPINELPITDYLESLKNRLNKIQELIKNKEVKGADVSSLKNYYNDISDRFMHISGTIDSLGAYGSPASSADSSAILCGVKTSLKVVDKAITDLFGKI